MSYLIMLQAKLKLAPGSVLRLPEGRESWRNLGGVEEWSDLESHGGRGIGMADHESSILRFI